MISHVNPKVGTLHMTAIKIQPDQILTNFLRANVTDVNSARVGQWIFPDFPRIDDLGDTNFPRIAITILTESSEFLGMFDDNQWETISFQIDVITKKDLIFNFTVTDEALGTMVSTVNSNRFTYDNVPSTITNISHNATPYGTVNFVTEDADFTAPGSLAADTVEVSRSTGNLNFSSVDVADDDGEAITSTYIVNLEGKKAVQQISRDVINKIRNNWRTDSTFDGLLYPNKISNAPQALDEDLGIYRQVLEYTMNGFNFGQDT